MKYRIEWSINDVDDSLETVSPPLMQLCEAVMAIQACNADEITMHAIDEAGEVKPGSLIYLTTDEELRSFVREILDTAELE